MSEPRFDYNVAQTSNFRLVIPDNPEVNYFLQTCQLPAINSSNFPAPWKNYTGQLPDNVIEYDPLTVTYLVSEDLSNYLFMKQWMQNAARMNRMHDHLKDLTLHILTNNKQSNIQVRFRWAFPTMISELTFDSASPDSVDQVNTVTFAYQQFDIFTGETAE